MSTMQFGKIFSKNNTFNFQNTAFAFSLIAVLALFVLPLPRFLLDFSLCISLTFSLVIFMTVLVIEKPLELSAFPTILLVGTMLRLALNVAATRLILTNGHNGETSAGYLIHAFGNFVMGGNFIIGIIVFALLVVINFIVITKGSGRIAEVAARFVLDALPGKQMSVDADLGAGSIDEKEAKNRRRLIQEEMSFFGAMDGAAKFVRGDAIAAILIVVINIVGGMVIGVLQNHMTFLEASKTYIFLTVGEGLVSQIPALILSVAAGMLVTKSSFDGSSDKQIIDQLSAYPAALGISSIFMFMLVFVPGLPKIPFFFIACVLAFSMKKALELKATDETQESIVSDNTKTPVMPNENPMQSLVIDPIRIELGRTLFDLLDQNGPLINMVKVVRNKITEKLGFIIPSVRIVDNVQLEEKKYAIFIKNILVADGTIYKDKFLALIKNDELVDLAGERVNEPINNVPAKWISAQDREIAKERGCAVINPATIIGTHLSYAIERNITELFSASTFSYLVENLEKSVSKIYQDIVPTQLSQSAILKICTNLLSEGVSIRDISLIIENIGVVSHLKNISTITEYVRESLGRYICYNLASATGNRILYLVSLNHSWEILFEKALIGDDENRILTLAPDLIQNFITAIKAKIAQYTLPFHLVTTPLLRSHVSKMIKKSLPMIHVLSYAEIQHSPAIEIIGEVEKQ